MSKSSHRVWFLILGSLLICLSCKDEPTAPGGGSGPSWLVYPVNVGRQWDYDRTISWDNIRILDSAAYSPFYTPTSMFSVNVSTTRTLMLASHANAQGDSVLVTEFRTVTDEPYYPESFEGESTT
jgi:hypothetical protein